MSLQMLSSLSFHKKGKNFFLSFSFSFSYFPSFLREKGVRKREEFFSLFLSHFLPWEKEKNKADSSFSFFTFSTLFFFWERKRMGKREGKVKNKLILKEKGREKERNSLTLLLLLFLREKEKKGEILLLTRSFFEWQKGPWFFKTRSLKILYFIVSFQRGRGKTFLHRRGKITLPRNIVTTLF